MSGLFDEMEADARCICRHQDRGRRLNCPNLFEQRSIKTKLIEEYEQAAKDAKAELKHHS